MDHDRLFKELLATFFVEFIELFFPELAEYLDRDSVEFLDKEVFTDVTHGEKHEADIVAKARFRSQEMGFLIHVEPQARREAVFRRRMFTYFAIPREIRLARLPDRLVLLPRAAGPRSQRVPSRVSRPDGFDVQFPGGTIESTCVAGFRGSDESGRGGVDGQHGNGTGRAAASEACLSSNVGASAIGPGQETADFGLH